MFAALFTSDGAGAPSARVLRARCSDLVEYSKTRATRPAQGEDLSS
jgi:hypothetical protein